MAEESDETGRTRGGSGPRVGGGSEGEWGVDRKPMCCVVCIVRLTTSFKQKKKKKKEKRGTVTCV